MQNNFPSPIVSEKDLTVYENYLNNGSKPAVKPISRTFVPETLTNPIFLPAYLKNHIGKLVKIESLVGDCLQARIGTLLEVGADFAVIKLGGSCQTLIIEGKGIKFITVIHDNDFNKVNYY